MAGQRCSAIVFSGAIDDHSVMNCAIRCTRPGLALTLLLMLSAVLCAQPHSTVQDGAVELAPIRHLRKGVVAWPHILNPKDDAERHINQRIAELNESLAHQLKECDANMAESWREGLPKAARNEEGAEFWHQAIKVTMTGPTYLSLVADVSFYCGGAHPYGHTDVAVFDLQTGEPANPLLWFGPSLSASLAPEENNGASLERSISSPQLLSVYRQLTESDDYPEGQVFLVWPDAKSHQVILQADQLPGCCAAEGVPVGLSIGKARELGFAESFIKSIEGVQPISGLPHIPLDRIVHLSPIQKIRKGADLLPVILNPRNEAELKINAALRRRNESVQNELKQCDSGWQFWASSQDVHASPHQHSAWMRRVQTTMTGPHYLSFLITSTAICNGSYPVNSREAIVFDLRTGDPVDWNLLAHREVPERDAASAADQGDEFWFSAKALDDLNLAGASPDCRSAFSALQPFVLWPDASKGLLMAEATDLPHVSQGCAHPIGLAMKELRALGFDDELIAAIQSAHQKYAQERSRRSSR